VRLNPADAEPWIQLATARRRQGDVDGAAAAGRRAVALGRASGVASFDALYNLGCDVRNCGGEGSVEEALLAFGDAAEARAISRLSLSLSLPAISRLSPGYLSAISRL